MLTDSTQTEELFNAEKKSLPVKLLAGLCALVVTGAVLAGYAFLRKRHAQQTQQQVLAEKPVTPPRGPAAAHILVDEPLIKGSDTVVGGVVKNISQGKLGNLAVELELRRRKDATLETMLASVNPPELEPGQEGAYSVKLPIQNYASVRLTGLRTNETSSLAYTSAVGQKRPPERLESKTIIVPRRSSGKEEFLNSPDNPVRVP